MQLGFSHTLCKLDKLNFLTGRPQAVRVDSLTFCTITITAWKQFEVVFRATASIPHTHDCVGTSDSSTITRLPDDTAVAGLIANQDESPLGRRIESDTVLSGQLSFTECQQTN